MKDNVFFEVIARVRTDFSEKFGIPRQSGLVKNLKGKIVFEPKYRDISALKGLDGFSHLWLIWKFSETVSEDWSPTVRPPRLGGNKRIGVFATRAPYRPNPIGLSSVKIEKIDLNTPEGPIIEISGADMLDGTPIYDIKPYIAYTDSHPEAMGGFSEEVFENSLKVEENKEFKNIMPEDKYESLLQILSSDPRPGYKEDSNRIYGLSFAGYEIKFTVFDGVLRIESITDEKRRKKI